MRHNLVFYNIKQVEGETQETLKETLIKLMRDDMKISPSDIYTKMNMRGEIRLDIVHRLGQSAGNAPQPVVAFFVTRLGKEMVFSSARNLKGKKVSVSE